MTTPLYQLKAEFFKTLGHPIRIRVLEILSEGPRTVAELNKIVAAEPSHLSQQLGILKRAKLISVAKSGSTSTYILAHPELMELLAVAKRILTEVLTDATEMLRDLQESTPV